MRRTTRQATRDAALSGAWAVVLCVLLQAGAARADGADVPGITPATRPVHAVGLALPAGATADALPPASAIPALPAAMAAVPAGSAWVVVPLAWSEFEPEAGRYTVAPLAARLAALAENHRQLVIEFTGGHPAYGRWTASGFEPPPGGAGGSGALDAYRRAWLRALRLAVGAAQGHASWFLLSGMLPVAGSPDDVNRAVFEMKSAAVAIRGEEPGCGVAFRAADDAERDLLLRTYAAVHDLAPYVDAIAAVSAPGDDPAATASRLREELLPVDPGASVWVEAQAPPLPPQQRAAEATARAMDALSKGADLAFVPLEPAAPDARGPLPGALALVALARALGPSFGAAPAIGSGLSVPDGVRFACFFDDQRSRELIVFWAAAEPEPGSVAALQLDTGLRRGFEVFDPAGVGVDVTRERALGAGKAQLDVSLYRRPLMLTIERLKVAGAAPLVAEEAQVKGAHRVSADEVIAAHQAWMAFQDERLANVVREGSISFRVRFAQVTGTFDVMIKADYLWSREKGADWSLRETYFNGIRLTWERFPEIPFISREKVAALPLDLTFDRRYVYELEGVEDVDGRSCWRIRFTPADEKVSLYRGRAWIDRRTAALVKASTIQTQLKPPMTSDEETQFYKPFEGPDGTTYWLLDRIEGQQLYSVSGSNVVVGREVRFGAPRINEPRFDQLKADAYASTRQMWRETPEGMKWLSREKDGTRRLLEKGNPTQLFIVGGLFKDESVSTVLPLGGVNYTNLDWLGKGALLNVFFAGLLANVAVSKPGLFGTRLDGGLTLNAVGFARQDKVYEDAQELESQRLLVYEQNLRGNLGIPLGQFFKLKGSIDVAYRNFHSDETTRDFRAPSDGFETTGSLDLTYDRAGWGLLGRIGTGHRSPWEPWGPESGLVQGDELERARDFRWYALGLQKAIFLPAFQKLELQATYQAGRDLDRFSAFRMDAFSGARVHGFGGAGIRYDHGVVASFGYSFNLRDVIRFDATIDQAYVNDPAIAPGMSRHTGIGFATNFLGPWQTLLRIDAGYALKSDLAAAKGGKELSLFVLRVF